MSDLQLVNFNRYLRELSIYTKNLIIYKANERGEDCVHIKSFQAILERKIDKQEAIRRFFNGEKALSMQLLDYLISCGEITALGDGYYAVLPIRNVCLPKSKIILEIGQLRENFCGNLNLGLSNQIKKATSEVMSIHDYRYDFNLKEWVSVLHKSTKSIALFNEEYYKPTRSGFQKISQLQDINKEDLYYILSYPPLGQMKEYYIARNVDGDWLGEKVNKSLLKSRLALLVNVGYRPSYKIKKVEVVDGSHDVFEIILSDFLPKTEREQVNLFSSPQQLNYSKKYYVQKKYLEDFLYILLGLKFIERNDE